MNILLTYLLNIARSLWGFRRRGLVAAVALLALVAAVGWGQTEVTLTPVKRFISIGTASINGAYYPLGTALARLFNSRLDDMIALAEPTSGSVTNVEHLRLGDVALALVQSDVALAGFYGRDGFGGRPVPRLRVLASLYAEVIHLVVRREAGCTAVAGLRGRRVALGEEGSGTALNARAILEAAGLAEGDYVAQYLPLTKATEALQRGELDAVFFTGGVPCDGVLRLAEKTAVTLVPLGDDVVARLTASQPAWLRETIPLATYPGLAHAVPTVGLRALLLATDDLEARRVQAMLEILYGNLDYLGSMCPTARGITLASATAGVDGTMLHPAAREFYQQRGVALP